MEEYLMVGSDRYYVDGRGANDGPCGERAQGLRNEIW